MLIRRAARALLRIELLDEKAAQGGWADHDPRVYGGLNNACGLFMRDRGAGSALPAYSSLKGVVSSYRIRNALFTSQRRQKW
jgi:hypothetical protein